MTNMPELAQKLHSPELERSLIGTLILNPKEIRTVKEILAPEMVYDSRIRLVFETLIEMARDKKPIDALLVYQEMVNRNRTEAIGGAHGGIDYLNNMAMCNESNLVGVSEELKQKHNLRQLINLNDDIKQQIVSGNGAKDVIEYANRKISEIVNLTYRNDLQTISAYIGQYIKRMNEQIKRGTEFLGISSGYPDMDKLTSGLVGGEYILIAGRTGTGKTAYAMSIAAHVGQYHNLLIFSLEMNRDELITRIASQLSGVPLWLCRNPGKMNEDQMGRFMEALDNISRLNLVVDESPALTMPEIVNTARAFQRNNPLGLIIIDHNQRIKADRNYKTEALKIQQITIDSADLAKELKVPVIGLHQMSRAIESRDENAEPKLTDLRESGEENANVVVFLIRNNDGTFGYILKNRGGPLGKWRMMFDDKTASFKTVPNQEEFLNG